jgi:hypothetical protein
VTGWDYLIERLHEIDELSAWLAAADAGPKVGRIPARESKEWKLDMARAHARGAATALSHYEGMTVNEVAREAVRRQREGVKQ